METNTELLNRIEAHIKGRLAVAESRAASSELYEGKKIAYTSILGFVNSLRADLAATTAEEGKILPKLREFLATATPEELEAKYRELEYLLAPKDEDADKAAEMAARRAYPYEGGTKGDICEASIPIFCKGFKDGIAYERERLMKEAPVADVIEMRGSTGPFADYPFMLSLGFRKIPNIEYHGGKVRVIIEEIKEEGK